MHKVLFSLFLTSQAYALSTFAFSPDEPWARQVLKFKEERLHLVTCGTTHGPRAFTRPLPNTLFFCLARPEPFDGRSILIHHDRGRRGWLYFEIFGCKRVASEVSGAAGYMTEACEVFQLSERSLKRKGRPVPFRIRTEWDEQVGGLQFYFRFEGHSFNGIPMNLYELRQLNP
ncbi:MAG: hypothetical protein KF767_15105 [Bdellovibrionaceae bacterium]|nr:hypothetical protein [Pseudobdellovibrionaceae bacterium]